MDKRLEEGKKQIEELQAQIKADVKERSAELSEAGRRGKAKLQADLDAAKVDLKKAQESATAQIEATRHAGYAKIASLKKQAPKGQEEKKS